MVEYNFVSSANIAIWALFTESGRSFTYKRNRAGPGIDPCEVCPRWHLVLLHAGDDQLNMIETISVDYHQNRNSLT